MVRLAIVAGMAALLLGTAAPAQAQRPTGSNLAQAYATAQQQVPGGVLIKVRIERGGSLYGFYFWKRGVTIELEVNLKGGVEKNTEKDGDKVSADVLALIEKQTKEKVKLPEGRLMEIAEEALKDSPFKELKYAKDGDKLVIQLGDDLVLDPTTGKVSAAAKK